MNPSSKNQHRTDVSVVVDHAYELWLWLDARTAGFPAAARSTVGRRVVECAIDLMEALVGAYYLPSGCAEQRGLLVLVNRKLGLLRLLLRGCRERRYLSIDQYDHASERCVVLGRMTGAWLKGASSP